MKQNITENEENLFFEKNAQLSVVTLRVPCTINRSHLTQCEKAVFKPMHIF